MCSVLLGSDLESGIGWPEPACMYHRYGHKALEYFIQFRSDLEKREKKSFRLYQKHKFIQFFDAFIAEILCLNFADDGIVEALDFFLIR